MVEMWYIHRGEWRWCIFTSTHKFASGESPFVDEKGKTFCKYIMGSVNVDHDGDRYGFVRNLKSLQDEVNARASKGLHLLNTRRVKMAKGAVDDVDALRREMIRPDGVIIHNPGIELEFDDQKTQVDLQGQLEFLAEVKTEIENFGPNPALIGEGIENKSGRAIALLQQAGIAELGPFILSFRGWKVRFYRAVWHSVKKYWTAERWIRVTDDEDQAKFIGLNQTKDPKTGLPFIDPTTGEPVVQNSIGALDVDIIIDEGPDTMNIVQETHETLKALAQSGAQVPPAVLIETSDLPSATKKKIVDMLEKANQPSPFDEAVMGTKLKEAEGKARKVNAEAVKIEGEAETGPMADRAAAFRDVASAAGAIAKAKQPAPQPHMFDR
jgi:hypothetical protein